MPEHFFWYLARTSALVAYMLLFINFCLGIGLTTSYLDRSWGRWRVYDLHQFTTALGGALIGLHILALLGDSYFNFTIGQLLTPMSSPYRPLWVTLGVVALYGGAVIVLSHYLRRLIGVKTWRILHYLSFLCFFAILFHGIKAGTDSSTLWVQGLYIGTGTGAVFLFLWRFLCFREPAVPQKEYLRVPTAEECLKNLKKLDKKRATA
jgi:predicted ferric reductase